MKYIQGFFRRPKYSGHTTTGRTANTDGTDAGSAAKGSAWAAGNTARGQLGLGLGLEGSAWAAGTQQEVKSSPSNTRQVS